MSLGEHNQPHDTLTSWWLDTRFSFKASTPLNNNSNNRPTLPPLPGSLGWDPVWGHSRSVQWSWVLRTAGRSNGTWCAWLCPPCPRGAGRAYLPQTHTATQAAGQSMAAAATRGGGGGRRKNNDTDSVLHWCWSAPWPLTSARWRLGAVAKSCWPCRPVSWSPPSPPGTGWARLRRAAQRPARWVIYVRFKIQKLYLALAHRLCSETWKWQCSAEIMQTAKNKTNKPYNIDRKEAAGTN